MTISHDRNSTNVKIAVGTCTRRSAGLIHSMPMMISTAVSHTMNRRPPRLGGAGSGSGRRGSMRSVKPQGYTRKWAARLSEPSVPDDLASGGGADQIHLAHARVAEGPVVTDADDHQRVIGAELAERAAEGLEVRAVARLDDECRFERQLDDRAEPGDRVVQLAVVGVRREAVPDQEEVARAGELRAGDENAAFERDPAPQPPHDRRRMPLLGQPDMPALIETGFGTEAAHGANEINRQITFMANLEQFDLCHYRYDK